MSLVYMNVYVWRKIVNLINNFPKVKKHLVENLMYEKTNLYRYGEKQEMQLKVEWTFLVLRIKKHRQTTLFKTCKKFPFTYFHRSRKFENLLL